MFSANSASASSTRLQLLVAPALQLLDTEHAPAQYLALAGENHAAGNRHLLAVGEQLEGVALLDVDQGHASLRQQQRAGVRVAAVGGR